MKCHEHDCCSFKVVNRFLSLEVKESIENFVCYGTSDATLNPAEVLLTKLTAERYRSPDWIFFNHPINGEWKKYDLHSVFEPYSLASNNTADILREMEVKGSPQILGLNEMLSLQDPLLKMTLEEAVERIKEYRDNRSFMVLSFLDKKGKPVPVFGTSKKTGKKAKLWREGYSQKTLREVLSAKKEKIGGTIIYFLYGYYLAKSRATGLMPHKPLGDVWGAVATGAEMAGQTAQLLPVGEIDLMTEKQWDFWREDKRWRKAPPFVLRELNNHPLFRSYLKKLLLDEKRHCMVSYNEEEDMFSFVEP